MSEEFQLDGEIEGIKYKTVIVNDIYTTVFNGKDLSGSFTYKADEIKKSKNPMEILHFRLFHSDIPDQSQVDAHQFSKADHETYFV